MEVEALVGRLADAKLRENARQWLSSDKNPRTLEEAKKLLSESSEEHLKDIFCKNLVFGTAGLRAPMGAGYSRLNDVTIQQASQGFCAYLLERHGKESCGSRGIVIGRDARHNSERFSHIAAAVFLSRGIKVYLFHDPVHTPLVPFALRKLNCVAGVMVTASHNPKIYNGYKVYDSNGVQIIPPVDSHVAQAIRENQALWESVEDLLDRVKGHCHEVPAVKGLLHDPREAMIEAYMSELSRDLCTRREETEKSDLKIVYTAMHGVGWMFASELLKHFGFSKNLIPVEKQCDLDPEFSSVPFPNPEEKGALGMSMEVADQNNVPLIIANDPDADRLACAEKCNGVWRQFTGDEVGIILAAYMADVRASQGIPKDKMLFVCSVVSSKMLKAFAEANKCVFEETPTGFKWMSNKAVELEESRNLMPVLVYEEALGYAVSPLVRDKDGVSAAAVLVELACHLHSRGSCLTRYLAELQARYGHFVTNNGYLPAQPSQQKQALEWLWNSGEYRLSFGRFKVCGLRDVARGKDTAAPDGLSRFPIVAGDMLTLRFDNGAVLSLRPSGTEPKLKWYGELSSQCPETATKELADLVRAVTEALPLSA